MARIARICTNLKYLGLLGLLGFVNPRLNVLWLFFLLGFVEIFYNPGMFAQSLQIVWGMIVVPLRCGKNVPGTQNFTSKAPYTLPFSGAWTVVNGGVTPASSHSWSVPSQRYAYDFLMLDDDGKSCNGEKTRAEDYFCYGQPILAPTDGEVVEIGAGRPDSPITGKAECKAHDIRGNYLLIRHADHEYSLLAHLKPGSLLVKAGDRVARGQTVAACGNSGNTSEPHLHFQLQDGQNSFLSAGLPVAFEGVNAAPAPNYARYDPRPLPQNDDAPPRYLRRGLRVTPK